VEKVGSQLLRTPPAGDRWAAERLVEAGEAAESRGDLDSALAFLGRALEEPPPPEMRPAVLHLLGRSELRAGVNDGYAHLEEAGDLAEPSLRAAIGFDLARAMLLAGRPEAVAAIERAVADLPPEERGDAVRKETELIALGRMTPATAPLVARLADGLEGVVDNEDPGWEAALGVLAGQAYLRNEPAARVAELARRSLTERRARGDDVSESAGFLNACHLLLQGGDYSEAERQLAHVIESARVANAPIGFVTAAAFRARSALRRGDLGQAEADARMALAAADAAFRQPTLPGSLGVLVEVLIERGELDEAERLLAGADLTGDLVQLAPYTELVHARGRLRLAQGRADDALADLTAAGEASLGRGVQGPGPIPWRPYAALALHMLRDGDEARAKAAEGLALARAYDAPYDLGVALWAAGLVARGDEGLQLLTEAVEVLSGSPVALELARARTDLGAALRRAGRRQDARAVLRQALDGASECGAAGLAERARAELVTAGAKPRRERISGPAALTASERRVTELALEGLTNRQIAEQLFVTASTVEKHLASVYSKLEIAGRAQLAGAFTPTTR
jgi:ATP/maltotriose-dependent transcriptional regulator MalT